MANRIAYSTATPLESGDYRAECPTVHLPYVGSVKLKTTIGGLPVVALVCALCDAKGRTHNLSLDEPQYHMYLDGAAEQTFKAGEENLSAAAFAERLRELRQVAA